jgi:hypothetical protein
MRMITLQWPRHYVAWNLHGRRRQIHGWAILFQPIRKALRGSMH